MWGVLAMNEEKTVLPFNNLEDKSGIEKKIEEIEKETKILHSYLIDSG